MKEGFNQSDAQDTREQRYAAAELQTEPLQQPCTDRNQRQAGDGIMRYGCTLNLLAMVGVSMPFGFVGIFLLPLLPLAILIDLSRVVFWVVHQIQGESRSRDNPRAANSNDD